MDLLFASNMQDQREQIKQKINLELENARFLSSFLMPMIILLGTLFFTKEYFSEFWLLRVFMSMVNITGIFIISLLRHTYLYSARKLIENL